ncbi:MAG: hypothetical protein ACI8PB_004193 [Desulforhopalus sp.]|jgi:hypothetical protein
MLISSQTKSAVSPANPKTENVYFQDTLKIFKLGMFNVCLSAPMELLLREVLTLRNVTVKRFQAAHFLDRFLKDLFAE